MHRRSGSRPFFFRKYVVFWIICLCSHVDKAGRAIYGSGDVSVTTVRSARSKNRYKKGKWDRVNLTYGEIKLVAFSLGKRI